MLRMQFPSKRVSLALAGLVLIAASLFAYVELKRPAPLPTFESLRPVGTVEDILALKERDDVNVLFVLVDTLRAHRMSAYGYPRDTTPFVSALARTGIRFDRNISQSSWTKSSMASLWSGLSPLHVGITKFDHTLSQDLVMPAEIMKDAGFLTVALYRNGWLHGYFGFDQGFDLYFRPVGSRADREAAGSADPNVLSIGTDEALAREAVEFLRIHGRTSRWFLYLHMMDLHEYVYDKESALFGTTASDIYDNSVRRSDWVLATIYSALNRFDLVKKTIVVIAADHGEAFGERGFEGHAREVLPETTETPLIISLPFALDGGVAVKTPTSNMDLWPTVLELLGLPNQGPDIDGHSRLPEILSAARFGGAKPAAPAPDQAEAQPIVSYLDQNWGQNIATVEPNISIVEGDHRYVIGNRADGSHFEELYSIKDGQRADQSDKEPELAAKLRAVAELQLKSQPAHGPGSVKMDQMQLDQLRALGYDIH
jgi:choline-sulfatase